MKKLLILMLVIIFSPSTVRAMDIFDTFNATIKDIDIVTDFKTNGFATFNGALIELLAKNPERGIFLVPSAAQLAKIAYAYATKPERDNQADKRFSYEELRQFRQGIIDLLRNKTLSWVQQPEKFRNQAESLLALIEQLQFPEKTWGNWAKSWVIEAGEDYKQWAESDVTNKLDPLIVEIKAFADASQFPNIVNKDGTVKVGEAKNSEVRSIAYIYTLYLQLLKSMLENYYKFKGPLLSGKQKAALCVGGACVGYAAYKVGKSMGSSAPTGGQ
jgi:hypothetical protein